MRRNPPSFLNDPLLSSGTSMSPSSSGEDGGQAPIELMSQFLLLISQRRMKAALPLCDSILEFEPQNRMMQDFRRSIRSYIEQDLDDPDEKESNDDEGDDDDEDEEEEEDGSHEDDDENENENEEDEAAHEEKKFGGGEGKVRMR